MRTMPATFVEHARDSSEFIWLVDVFPVAGVDSWPQFRWGERAVRVAGADYEGGILESVGAIKDTVRILAGGGVATRDAVDIGLIDKTKELHRTIQSLDIEGRDVQIALALFPLNLLRNSSFEAPTSGNNFDFWTETAGHASNSITRQTSGPQHGAQYARLSSVASPGPIIQSDTVSVRRGTTVSLSFYAKGNAGGQFLRAKILWNGLYWNNSTRLWQAGATHVTFTLTTSWARYTLENVYSATEPFTNADAAPMSVLFESFTTSQTIDIDAVQLEARPRVSSYHGGRYDMATSDLYPVYWGEVRKPRWDRGTVKLGTKSIMNRRHRDIPTAVLTQDTNPDWAIPPDNLGKPFPMTYGDFFIDYIGFGKLYPHEGVAARGLLVNGKNDPEKVRVHFDRPGIALGSGGEIYHFDEDSQTFIRDLIDASGGSEWVGVLSDSYREANTTTQWLWKGLMPLSLLLFAFGYGNETFWSNPEDAVDGDLGTYTDVTISGAAPQGRTIFLHIKKPNSMASLPVIAAYLLAKVQLILNSGSGAFNCNVGAIISGSGGPSVTALSGAGTFDNIPTGVPWHADETDKPYSLGAEDSQRRSAGYWLNPDRDLSFNVDSTSGSPNVTIRIYEGGMRIDVAVELVNAQIFKSTYGRTFGTTWGGRKTAASEIFNAPDVIEGILRHELGLDTADINTALFDQANTDISGRGFAAGQVIERTPSVDVIEKICECHGIVYYVDGAGKEAIRVLKHDVPDKVLRPRDFIENAIAPEFIEREEIISDFSLRWGHVPGTDIYIGHTYCNRNGSNIGDSAYETKCGDAWTTLGERENPREYLCDWINDEASAQGVLMFLIDWSHRRRRIVKNTGFLDQLDLEFGDRVDLQLEEYLLERDTDTVRPIFTPYERTLRKPVGGGISVDMSFLEVIAP